MNSSRSLLDRLRRFLNFSEDVARHAQSVQTLLSHYGLLIVEHDPKGNARAWNQTELDLVTETINLLGSTFYEPFLRVPIHVWIDRHPGGGGYGNQWLRVGEGGHDRSILYRMLLHEVTHASNEYRGWPYENTFCTRPGLDWRREGSDWTHPRQQGKSPEPGQWETLPVDARDVSTAPGEDLAEMVRYYVHSVRDERVWLWPLDLSKPPIFLWDTSPTRFVYLRDYFLALPADHPWYKSLPPALEQRAADHLAG